MTSAATLSGTAALIGDPARANILTALLDGRALTATELAHVAGVTAQTASGHLGKLVEGRLLGVAVQGRHRYFRLASPEVARMLETILVVAAARPEAATPRATPRVSPALREARTCYDHLAGRLGVAIADALVSRGLIVLGEEAGEATEAGRDWLARFGVPVAPADGTRRIFCRPCLDWSERRPHLAGRLGAALCRRCDELGWIERARDARVVTVTETGRSGFADIFGICV
ncbi:ArsR/SmtB family transcription factor [Methylobacterium planeticum]|uniref:Winged helix-turn-helix transcriptional regulator n=1 Tax=Methylobacterium planeticum TaxID=2615211 RepID=A0A6N6MRY4_9HYPH|nr:winged helix-turn-helix domain-containing protein [Methylobacterium planeticum]KAB1073970.1 winged helix-turn-helix transcriptional regulator [Methylobacterium planeticum]